jgi:hypothetical protein
MGPPELDPGYEKMSTVLPLAVRYITYLRGMALNGPRGRKIPAETTVPRVYEVLYGLLTRSRVPGVPGMLPGRPLELPEAMISALRLPNTLDRIVVPELSAAIRSALAMLKMSTAEIQVLDVCDFATDPSTGPLFASIVRNELITQSPHAMAGVSKDLIRACQENASFSMLALVSARVERRATVHTDAQKKGLSRFGVFFIPVGQIRDNPQAVVATTLDAMRRRQLTQVDLLDA